MIIQLSLFKLRKCALSHQKNNESISARQIPSSLKDLLVVIQTSEEIKIWFQLVSYKQKFWLQTKAEL